MKNLGKAVAILIVAVSVGLPTGVLAQNDYYFPEMDETELDKEIPSPKQFLGYDIGTHYTRHDRIVAYFKELAEHSDKASFQVIGETYEKRPQVVLTISSPENHSNIEDIRQQHLTLLDPEEPVLDPSEGKSIVALNYSVHGDETSSGEAAMLTAYYLIANESDETQEFLDESVIHIDPAQNPDGRDRAAHWHNSYKSFPAVADPVDAEHNQAWPRGRTNHFLHDLNRDWFAVTQQESENRVDFYHRWYPNVQIDFHEMGTNSTYYLEPTQPVRTWNPIIPEYHYEVMNPLLAEYQTEALDNLGSLYWTKEIFDNISPIYGSTYPDIQGGVGVTFEVGSSRGLVQESNAGEVTFRSTILKHLHTGIATVRAAVNEKQKLFEYQKDFYQSAREMGQDQPTEAYIFGDDDNLSLTHKFLDLLLTHRLDVFEIDSDIEQNGKTFEAGSSYMVPTDQIHYRVIHDIFEANTSFPDSVFYDITGWSLAHGYGIEYEELESNYSNAQGAQVTELPERSGTVKGGASEYAYLLKWSDYNASPALYDLLDSDFTVRVAHKPFTANVAANHGEEFGYGTIVISVQEQGMKPSELYQKLRSVAKAHNVTFYSVDTGMTPSGIDLGSTNVRPIDKPEVAMVVGEGTSSYEVGEAWFLLNMHVGMDVTKIRSRQFPSTDLQRYNTIILVDGNYSKWKKSTVKKVRRWVRSGGVLITNEDASRWAIEKELVSEDLIKTFEDTAESKKRYNYEEQADRWRADTIPGTILEADIDPSNPIAFGTPDRRQLFIKNSSLFLDQSENPYATVAQYTNEPFVGGHINDKNLDKVRGTSAVVARSEGNGNVILFADDPNFRSYWHTTSRLFLNAIFFGQNLSL
ncbi:M14 family zinc carboxypeptidase [Fodinibius sp. Rm-B-1B1-1]|uniref:M14 family zinc carboxypeptidase n=1 Tax=Fodinibius alkaliphilus TaxID=3140241 RepID=UPI00315B0A7C